MTTICFNCKHWGDEKITASRHRVCNHPKNLEMDDEEEDSFSMHDSEPFGEGRFCTGPKFGCIHFEL